MTERYCLCDVIQPAARYVTRAYLWRVAGSTFIDTTTSTMFTAPGTMNGDPICVVHTVVVYSRLLWILSGEMTLSRLGVDVKKSDWQPYPALTILLKMMTTYTLYCYNTWGTIGRLSKQPGLS